MTTDGYVISPLFFPGGDIGSLAVHGTINDVAMAGARPLYLSACFIIEEGFPLADLQRIVQSMAAGRRDAGVPVVTGDTKVVEKGKGDGVFISTTGIGLVSRRDRHFRRSARPGDAILISGTHGRPWRRGDEPARKSGVRNRLCMSDSAALHGAGRGHGGRGSRHPLPARSDPRRPGLDAERIGRPVRRRHADPEAAIPVRSGSARARANCWASTRSMWPTRAS